jgi:signal peptidase II
MSARSSRWLWLMAAVLVADRATKFVIERYTPDDFRRVLVPGVAWLVHSTNPGIAFGLFAASGSHWTSVVLIASAIAVVAALGWALATGRAGATAEQAGLALIGGGAAGNVLDRLIHGGVTDFLELHAGRFEWPAFNLADSAITIGAVLVLYELLRGQGHGAGPEA